MTHAYRIGYFGYEDHGGADLLHDTLFSEAQFEAMVADVVPQAHARRHAEEARASGLAGLRARGFTTRQRALHFGAFWEDVVELLVQRHGFRKAPGPVAAFVPFADTPATDDRHAEANRHNTVLADALRGARGPGAPAG